MNGLGNDFVVIDSRAQDYAVSYALARSIANRTDGIGCDQVIVLKASERADVFMSILNADGSEVDACGNATRCVATLGDPYYGTIETKAGILRASVTDDGFVSVDMGRPRFEWSDIPLSSPQIDTRAIALRFELPDGRALQDPSVVNVGNPHCIFWVTDADDYDLASFGRELEHNPLFPERANISLAEVTPGDEHARDRIKLRVWERGAGITQACGTAACAVAVAAHRSGKTGRIVDVDLPGGRLVIEWRADDGHIFMTGPASHDFDGIIHLNGDGTLHSYDVSQRP